MNEATITIVNDAGVAFTAVYPHRAETDVIGFYDATYAGEKRFQRGADDKRYLVHCDGVEYDGHPSDSLPAVVDALRLRAKGAAAGLAAAQARADALTTITEQIGTPPCDGS